MADNAQSTRTVTVLYKDGSGRSAVLLQADILGDKTVISGMVPSTAGSGSRVRTWLAKKGTSIIQDISDFAKVMSDPSYLDTLDQPSDKQEETKEENNQQSETSDEEKAEKMAALLQKFTESYMRRSASSHLEDIFNDLFENDPSNPDK